MYNISKTNRVPDDAVIVCNVFLERNVKLFKNPLATIRWIKVLVMAETFQTDISKYVSTTWSKGESIFGDLAEQKLNWMEVFFFVYIFWSELWLHCQMNCRNVLIYKHSVSWSLLAGFEGFQIPELCQATWGSLCNQRGLWGQPRPGCCSCLQARLSNEVSVAMHLYCWPGISRRLRRRICVVVTT